MAIWSGDTGHIGRLGRVDGRTVALTGCHVPWCFAIIQHVEYSAPMARVNISAQNATAHWRNLLKPNVFISSRSINILTEQGWSKKDLLYVIKHQKNDLRSCGTKREIPDGQDSSIFLAHIANHSGGFDSSYLLHGCISLSEKFVFVAF